MLPEIRLQKVSRDDLNRVRNWNRKSDSIDGWLGHYSINGVLDIGYDSEKVLSLSDAELSSLLDNNRNEIRSVYDDDDNHLGESRVLFLSDNAAEISIFIGDSKLSNQGYGTSVLIHLLEELFVRYNFRYILLTYRSPPRVPSLLNFTDLCTRIIKLPEISYSESSC